jgi:hypothetical protein
MQYGQVVKDNIRTRLSEINLSILPLTAAASYSPAMDLTSLALPSFTNESMPSRGLPPLAPPNDEVRLADVGFLPWSLHDGICSAAYRRAGANGRASTPNEAMNSAARTLMADWDYLVVGRGVTSLGTDVLTECSRCKVVVEFLSASTDLRPDFHDSELSSRQKEHTARTHHHHPPPHRLKHFFFECVLV